MRRPQSRKGAAADSRSFGNAASLEFPGGMPQFVACPPDLILSAAQKDQKFLRRNTSGNHDGFVGNDDLLDESTGAGVFGCPSGYSEQRRVLGGHGIEVECRIDEKAIEDLVRSGKQNSLDAGNFLPQPVQNVAELVLCRACHALNAVAGSEFLLPQAGLPRSTPDS